MLEELEDVLYPDIIDLSPEKTPFEVTDLSAADWALAKAKQAQLSIDQRKQMARAYIDKINAWLADANKSDYATMEFMAGALNPWVKQETQQTKKKSIKLVSGTVGFRKAPASIDIEDEEQAMTFCKDRIPQAVKTKEYLLKSEIKKHVEKTGELPDGVRFRSGEEKFYLDVKEKE